MNRIKLKEEYVETKKTEKRNIRLFCAVNAALMDATVWVVTFDPEFISWGGFLLQNFFSPLEGRIAFFM